MKFFAWLLAVLTAGYLVPWAIAVQREKSDVGAVFVINLLLGWTIIGWVWALVKSLND
jgi:4-hydroxybenzoate polyprenyltransferase